VGIYSLRRRVLWWRDTVTSCSRVNRHARHTSFAQISTANYLQAVFADLQLQVSPRLVCIPVAAVSTTICCFRSVSTTLSRNPSAARDANPNHRHGFPWFLLRCSCIVDCFNCLLHSVTRSDNHWLQTGAENFCLIDGLCCWPRCRLRDRLL